MEQGSAGERHRTDSGWPAAAGLLVVVFSTPEVASRGVLIGVPLLLLLAARGFGNVLGGTVAGLVILMVAGGRGGLEDVLWYAERGWAVLLGGLFVALTLLLPKWRLTSRALVATAGAALLASAVFVVRADAWGGIDAAVGRVVQHRLDVGLGWLSDGGASWLASSELRQAVPEMVRASVAIFPALLFIESLAALGVAWWARAQLLGDREQGLSPLRSFRFNDHLVWVLVVGLLLVLLPGGLATGRIGANALVLMGALYALRGAAVFVFVSGGMSLLGYAAFAVLLLLVSPVVIGTAALIGIGDTWLDLRSRTADEAA